LFSCAEQNNTNQSSTEIEKDTISITTKTDNTKPEEKQNTTQTIFNQRAVEEFLISTQRDTVIKGKKGVLVYIPGDAFETKSNSKVKIQLEEYLSISDMLFACLTTTSNGKLLETNGMINIKASIDNTELKLKPNKEIIVHFPKKNKTKEMHLFYGEQKENDINWQKDNTDLFVNKIKLIVVGSIGGSVSSNGEKPRIAMLQDSSKYQFAYEYFENNFNYDPKSYDDKFNRYLANNRIRINFKISKNGKAEEIRIEKPSPDKSQEPISDKNFERDVINFISNELPLMKYVYQPRLQNSFVVRTDTIRVSRYMNNKEYVKSFEKKYMKGNTFKEEELDYYIFAVSKLGWINCDRFPDIKSPKTNFIVTIDTTYKTEARIILTDFKSITNNYQVEKGDLVFKNIPTKLKIKLLLIQYRNNKTYYDIKESNTSNLVENKFNFQPVTVAELKTKLETLN